jgi:hypothetical protein
MRHCQGDTKLKSFINAIRRKITQNRRLQAKNPAVSLGAPDLVTAAAPLTTAKPDNLRGSLG